jgi:carboxymethylenebutenolidase
MIEKQVEIMTASGRMNSFICHPERGSHPVVIFFMDAPGIREELRDMARRLAVVGYYVVLPNLYYRFGAEELGAFTGEAWAGARERIFALMGQLTIPMVMEGTGALLAHAATDPAAAPGPAGCLGYCMSGQYAISAAAVYPDRIAAAASIYGTRLMTEAPDSPHLAARRARAELYIACAEIDEYMPVAMVAPLRNSLRDGGVKAEVEIYPGVAHGFAFPERGAYNREAAERHWERVFALFARTLG